jgi:hypothetical protein
MSVRFYLRLEHGLVLHIYMLLLMARTWSGVTYLYAITEAGITYLHVYSGAEG